MQYIYICAYTDWPNNYNIRYISFILSHEPLNSIEIIIFSLAIFVLHSHWFRFAKYREVRESVHNFEGCVAACIVIAYEDLLNEVGGNLNKVSMLYTLRSISPTIDFCFPILGSE